MTTDALEDDQLWTRSLRRAWNAAYASYGDIAGGLYHGAYASQKRAFPFRSIRKLIDAARWPQGRYIDVPDPASPFESVPTAAPGIAPALGGGEDPLPNVGPITQPAGQVETLSLGAFQQRTRRVLSDPLLFVRKSPDNYSSSWTNSVNGITHDDNFWYFAQEKDGIARILASVPLNKASGSSVAESPVTIAVSDSSGKIPIGAVPAHLGALVWSRGFLYVPVENTSWVGSGSEAIPAQIWTVDPRKLAVVNAVRLDPGWDKASWCAINEGANLLYTSHFFDDGGGTDNQIRVYRFVPHDGVAKSFTDERLELLTTVTLTLEDGRPFPAERVQGGVVTDNNHLLMVCDTPQGTAVSGLHLFDLVSGRRRWHVQWPEDVVVSTYLGGPEWDEAQGVTMWNFGGDACVFVAFAVRDIDKTRFSLMWFDTVAPWQRRLL